MYSTPASAIAAIMASPLSSAGTSTQARLSLRSIPACLFMAALPSAEFVSFRGDGQGPRRRARWREGPARQTIGAFARGNAEGYARNRGGRAHDRDASSMDRWLADGAGAAGRGAAQPV